MLNLSLQAFQSQEFIVGIAVAAIMVAPSWPHRCSATSRWRSPPVPWCCSTCRAGLPALVETSTMMEKEIRALPDFSNGLVVGLAVSAVLLIGLQRRSA